MSLLCAYGEQLFSFFAIYLCRELSDERAEELCKREPADSDGFMPDEGVPERLLVRNNTIWLWSVPTSFIDIKTELNIYEKLTHMHTIIYNSPPKKICINFFMRYIDMDYI